MNKELERVENSQEPSPESSGKESKETVSKETKTPTLGIKETPEFQEALKEAQKGWDRLDSKRTAEAEKQQRENQRLSDHIKEREENEMKIRREMDDLASRQFADDPEALKAFKDRRAIDDERAENRKAREDTERLATAAILQRQANVLSKENTIDLEILEACSSVEEMQKKVIEHLKVKPQETQRETQEQVEQKFDSASSSGGGGTSFTREQILNMSQSEFEANQSAINKARREGKIK